MAGWIKLHRSLLEWEWFDDHNTTRLLVYLLCAVNHEQKKWKGMTIEPGSMVFSWNTLSERCYLSVRQCRTAMQKLEESGEVTRSTYNKWQLVSLCKWEELQGSDKKMTSNMTSKGQTDDRQMTTTKECKNNKNEKKEEILLEKETKGKFNFKNELLNEGFEKDLVEDWLQVRKKKKATNTKTALNRFLKEVKSCGVDKNEILTLCIERSWSGFKSEWLKNQKNNYVRNTEAQTGAATVEGVSNLFNSMFGKKE